MDKESKDAGTSAKPSSIYPTTTQQTKVHVLQSDYEVWLNKYDKSRFNFNRLKTENISPANFISYQMKND